MRRQVCSEQARSTRLEHVVEQPSIKRMRSDLGSRNSLLRHEFEFRVSKAFEKVQFALELIKIDFFFTLSVLAVRHPALAQAVMAPLICWSFSSSMFKYLLVYHVVPAM